VIAARCDHLTLAFDYAAEATLMDLQDLEHNVADGLHMASLAGGWLVFVVGLAGLRHDGDVVGFSPKLPEGLTRYAFSITLLGLCVHVNVTGSQAEYTLRSPGTLELRHYDEQFTLTAGTPFARPLPPIPRIEPPRQPPGREPRHR
jgi:alpha,alpha-trehalose phosphorylase